MVDWKLRRANPQDALALALCVDAAYHPHLSQTGKLVSTLEAHYTQLIALYQVWTAVVQGEIIGGLVLIPKEDHMLLANIVVHPEHQGKGIGQALLELADGEALGQGYQEIHLYTNIDMTKNIDMYRRSGWTEIQSGMQEGHRISMRKVLQPHGKSRR
jgi:N-acetylglutamate synthase-like GNAT family acetyltransferase